MHRRILLPTALLLSCLLAGPSIAHAATLFRAYVASTGNDANPCTLQQPCRLLPAALAAVQSGGEIWMLDSANFNTATVVVSKSVTILAVPGAVGSVVATGGPAIEVATPGLRVALRNLVIGPLNETATHGVRISGNSRVSIEGSLIANLPGTGVLVQNGAGASIADSTIRSTGDDAVRAYEGATVEISRSKLLDSGTAGLAAIGTGAKTTAATISDSVISRASMGVNAYASGGFAVARVTVTRTTIEQAGMAVWSGAPAGNTASISLMGSTIAHSGYAWWIEGVGVIRSFGNNAFTYFENTQGMLTSADLQ